VSWPIALFFFGLACCGLTAAAACACTFYGDRETCRPLIRWMLLWTAATALWLGGGALLFLAGMGWRRWVKGLLFLILVISSLAVIHRTEKLSEKILPRLSPAVSLCSAGAVLWVLAALFLSIILINWSDRVTVCEGEKSVAESSGIFRESVYRYVNPFVRGELLWEFQD